MSKICQYCGRAIIYNNPQAKKRLYCCDKRSEINKKRREREDKKREIINQRMREYRKSSQWQKWKKESAEKNKKRRNKYLRDFRRRNPEIVRGKERERYHKNPETYKQSHRRWAKKNPDKQKARRIRFKINNPERAKLHGQRAYAMRKAKIATTDITTDFLLELKKDTKFCPYCAKKTNDWHLDHKTPLCRHGTHTKANVCYCCGHCNMSKGKKTVKEFKKYLQDLTSV